jgi:hypothetical protein
VPLPDLLVPVDLFLLLVLVALPDPLVPVDLFLLLVLVPLPDRCKNMVDGDMVDMASGDKGSCTYLNIDIVFRHKNFSVLYMNYIDFFHYYYPYLYAPSHYLISCFKMILILNRTFTQILILVPLIVYEPMIYDVLYQSHFLLTFLFLLLKTLI